MASASDHLRGRIDIRVSDPREEERLRLAATMADEPVTRFMLDAALERADEVLGSRTVVPADYFDQLMAALDEPAVANPRLAAAAARPRVYRWR